MNPLMPTPIEYLPEGPDVYTEEWIEDAPEEDLLTSAEQGFMRGYLDA